MAHKTYLNWSTGKDAALALYYLQQDRNYELAHLLTSVNSHYNRVSMHGVRRELLQQQIIATGLSFSTIELPEQPSMQAYEMKLKNGIQQLKEQGFTHAAFGDIFLEDLRSYREQQMNQMTLNAVFPLWKKDTKQMLKELISTGFKAIVVCVDAQRLSKEFAGRIIDETFLSDLPKDVDPCGENGEFHTFCFDGPVFKNRIPFSVGEIAYKEYNAPRKVDSGLATSETKMGFWFCDLLPGK